jgi:prevent-host-death family protein
MAVAIIYGYPKSMDVSVAEAKNQLPQLLRAVEGGESVVITRNGRPVAQLVPAPAARRKARLGGMRGKIRFLPGWDKPVDLDRFLDGDL